MRAASVLRPALGGAIVEETACLCHANTIASSTRRSVAISPDSPCFDDEVNQLTACWIMMAYDGLQTKAACRLHC